MNKKYACLPPFVAFTTQHPICKNEIHFIDRDKVRRIMPDYYKDLWERAKNQLDEYSLQINQLKAIIKRMEKLTKGGA